MNVERSGIVLKSENEIITLLNAETKHSISPDMVFKNSYILDFLNLSYLHVEKQLENAIISQLEKFIMELGNGLAFWKRQKRISIDAIDYHLDLLFYHRKLNCLVEL
jgi:predicted nuclease of restriction endonuclease-like (RecB) superfamily